MRRLREGAEHGDHRPMGELSMLIRLDNEALEQFRISLNNGGLLVNAQKELKHTTTAVEAMPVGVREINFFDDAFEPVGRLFQLPCPNVHARARSKTKGEVVCQNAKQVLPHCIFERDVKVCCSKSEMFGLKERPESFALPANKKRQTEEIGVPLQ